jgi:hypothetical protein
MVHLDVKKVGRIRRRRRLAGTWPRQRPGIAVQARARDEGRLHLPALGRGRLLPAGLHRSPPGREGGDDDRVLLPGEGVLRRPRHREDPPGRHRQRRQLPGPGQHRHRGGPGRPAPADPPLHAPAQRQSIERFNRLLADEVLYARPYPNEQARRDAIGVWVNHFNYHRPHTPCGDQPLVSRVPVRANNVTPSYTRCVSGRGIDTWARFEGLSDKRCVGSGGFHQ